MNFIRPTNSIRRIKVIGDYITLILANGVGNEIHTKGIFPLLSRFLPVSACWFWYRSLEPYTGQNSQTRPGPLPFRPAAVQPADWQLRFQYQGPIQYALEGNVKTWCTALTTLCAIVMLNPAFSTPPQALIDGTASSSDGGGRQRQRRLGWLRLLRPRIRQAGTASSRQRSGNQDASAAEGMQRFKISRGRNQKQSGSPRFSRKIAVKIIMYVVCVHTM